MICGCAGTGRQASLRCWCRIDVWVQVPSAAPLLFNLMGLCADAKNLLAFQTIFCYAGVMELVDVPHSKCGGEIRAGSNPATGTIFYAYDGLFFCIWALSSVG